MNTILEVQNLKTRFTTDDGTFFAVDDVSFVLPKGKTLGIVGESGCGKSVTSLSIMRLITKPGEIVSGSIKFKGENLLEKSTQEMQKIRGNEIAMIFQEPMTSLNPVFTIGEQIEETIRRHRPGLTKSEYRKKTVEILTLVGIPAPERRYSEYPHQLSGGMRQRIMIAIALSCNPSILIADEPTTALDVTIQAQILDLMRKLTRDLNTSLILITHDLGVVAEMCDEVVVMYAGRVIEQGSVKDIFQRPRHPYTRGLLDSIPHFDSGHRLTTLNTIPGLVPSLLDLPKGCRFASRCKFKKLQCEQSYPELKGVNHKVSCFFPLNEEVSV